MRPLSLSRSLKCWEVDILAILVISSYNVLFFLRINHFLVFLIFIFTIFVAHGIFLNFHINCVTLKDQVKFHLDIANFHFDMQHKTTIFAENKISIESCHKACTIFAFDRDTMIADSNLIENYGRPIYDLRKYPTGHMNTFFSFLFSRYIVINDVKFFFTRV